ncbi:hypothetical protein FACUT_6201 [Fusarium acutatum]|uniref:Uncharacterized protein n=1 Tax=Fusarium acutatum TaxID=78861 RepID=A0A8H4NLR1_9HYPO|nr:hypothetical protein FACUT_6201 [Fusarium acutatum]
MFRYSLQKVGDDLHEEDWKSRKLMNREVCMLKLEKDITSKSHWWGKVLNTDIVSKWKQEALQMPWARYQHNGDFTSKMADVSYINNLHPVRYKAVYSLIEELVEKSLSAWDIVCRSARKEFRFKRFGTVHEVKWTCNVPEICAKVYGCYPSSRPLAEGEDYDSGPETSSVFEEGGRLNREWWSETHKIQCPEPLEDATYPLNASHFKIEGVFNDASQIQVIVKMANIHLTPEKPIYNGGSWHVEGQLNEHICTTALFYHDSDNITESRLFFHTHADRDNLRDRLSYSQGDHHGIEAIFAIRAKGDKMQDLGSVMTPEGRALFFPNIY